MIAADTNVLVRFLVDDDPEQSPRALALLRRHDVLIGPTVLLETAWVLRSGYGLPPDKVRAMLTALMGLPNVRLTHPAEIARAMTLCTEGLDLADALHLAFADEAEAFSTFDAHFLRQARRLKLSVIAPP